jgi:hypothetical protein
MGVSPFVSPKRKLVIFLWFGSAAPRFPELHAGLVAIGEFDAMTRGKQTAGRRFEKCIIYVLMGAILTITASGLPS